MELTKGIRRLLVAFIDESVIVTSWGVTNIRIGSGMIVFDVSGLLYKGSVIIKEYNSSYNIKMSDCEFTSNLEDIVSFLDRKIERSDNYTADLIDWLNKQ